MITEINTYDKELFLVQEASLIDAITDDTIYGLTDVFNFFKSIATLNLDKYLDSKLTTKLSREIYLAQRDKEDISRVEYTTIYNMEVAVPVGMDTPYLPLLNIAKKNLPVYTKTIRKEIEDFNKDLDAFISNKAIRQKITFVGSNKELDKRNKEVDKLITNNLSKNANTVATVSRLIRNFNEYSESLEICSDLIEISNNKELKYTLDIVAKLHMKLAIITDLAERGEIMPQGIRRLEERTTTIANSITVIGKLQIIKFEGDSLIVALRRMMLDAK